MFRKLYKDPKFIGAQTSPPNIVTVIMEDGIETYTVNDNTFRSEATLDKQNKELKGTWLGKEKISQLFFEPVVGAKGRFVVTLYEF